MVSHIAPTKSLAAGLRRLQHGPPELAAAVHDKRCLPRFVLHCFITSKLNSRERVIPVNLSSDPRTCARFTHARKHPAVSSFPSRKPCLMVKERIHHEVISFTMPDMVHVPYHAPDQCWSAPHWIKQELTSSVIKHTCILRMLKRHGL